MTDARCSDGGRPVARESGDPSRRAVVLLAASLLVAAAASPGARLAGQSPLAKAASGRTTASQPDSPRRAAAEALKARAAERIRALEREADALAAQQRTLVGDLRRLEVERDLRTLESSEADARLQEATARVAATERRIAQTEADLAAARPRLTSRMISLYKLGRPGYARLVLSVGDPARLGRTIRLSGAMATLDRNRVREYERTLAALAQARGELARRQAEAAATLAERQRAREAASRAVAARAAIVGDIDRRRDLASQLVAELRQAEDRLQRTISAMVLSPASAAAVEESSLPIRPFRGALPWPVAGRVTLGFGPQRNSRFGTSTVQAGVEIGSPDGAAVSAVHGGRVVYADLFAGYGQLVILDHGGDAFTLYGYLGTLSVAKGESVAAGQALGTAGRGPSGGGALYFELRIDGQPVDPVQWLKSQS